jgi:uncharacterized protein YigE (DUF2233 family)
MLKLILISILLWVGVLLIRRRWRIARGLEAPAPTAVLRYFAPALLVAMVTLTAIQAVRQWHQADEVLTVQVVNANTGQVTLYQARRGSLDGRQFRTVDGREIRMADVERMIILSAETTN